MQDNDRTGMLNEVCRFVSFTTSKVRMMKQIWKYIQSDYYRYSGRKLNPFQLFVKAVFSMNHCFRYSFWMRMASLGGVSA